MENIDNYTYEQLSEYVATEFMKAVVLFNYIGGVHIDKTESVEQAIEKTKLMMKVAHEEFIENISAIGWDDEQELDGAVDQMFTFPYLSSYIDLCAAKFGDEYIELLQQSPCIRAYAVMASCIEVIQPLQETHIPVGVFKEACDRVVKNNMTKFTANREEAESWQFPVEGCSIASQEYDGVEYHYIIDSGGKVKKRVGFEGVDLSDLVAKIKFNSDSVTLTEESDDE